ncbi:MAG: glycosyltransferase family 4 protein [Anaerolineae bacterium]
MTNTVAILHYAAPPTIGGVEATIAYHARGLADLGYAVRVISGSGGEFDDRVTVSIDPLLSSTHPEVLALKKELDSGTISPAFDELTQRIRKVLEALLADCSVCIVHNAHTLHKNMALTAALHQLSSPRLIAWAHDLAWTNEQYLPELHNGYPYDLLRTAWQGSQYVTVSEMRRGELAELLHIPPESITVVEPGIDPQRFFGWTEQTRLANDTWNLLDAEGILLLPARITRRKNIQLGLTVLAELRRNGRDFRLIVSGPPGPHNPANPGYLGELVELSQRLNLQGAAHFFYQLAEPSLIPDDDTMSNLFMLSDALFFPSTQEGFGIPVLEAGIAGLPVFCSDIPPFRQSGGEDVTYFDPANDPPAQIAATIREQLDQSPVARLRRRVRQQFRWDSIIKQKIVPLLG